MVLPFLIPMGMMGGVIGMKMYRNAQDTGEGKAGNLAAHTTRENSVIERLTTGSTPPVAYWNEKYLEKMIKTNSAFRDNADALRAAQQTHNSTAMGA